MIFHGLMCVKNEARWIAESVSSLLSLCDLVFVLDDHSTDNTVGLCRSLGPRVIVYEKQINEPDRVADKNLIYAELLQHLPPALLNESSPYWVVSIDGDEVLESKKTDLIREAAETWKGTHALSLQICYLWDTPKQARVDGVYGEFYRPSIFRVINPSFIWQPTPFPENTHCPCVPQDLVGYSSRIPVRLKHYGYMERQDRIRKYRDKCLLDPGNLGEDYYRHVVQGDLPSLPPDLKLKHAGPLKLVKCDF